MNPLLKERWLHLLLYIGLAYYFAVLAMAHMQFNEFPGWEKSIRFVIPFIIFGIVASWWETYREKRIPTFDYVDVIWSLIGAMIGTYIGIYHPTVFMNIFAAVLTVGSIVIWFLLNKGILKLNKKT